MSLDYELNFGNYIARRFSIEYSRKKPRNTIDVDLDVITADGPRLKKEEGSYTSALKTIKERSGKVEHIVEMFTIRFFCIQANEILYSVGCLGLFLSYQYIERDYFNYALTKSTMDVYFKATWIEVALEGSILIIVTLCWFMTRTYKALPINDAVKVFFKNLIMDFVIITLALLISFLFWVKSMAVY